MVVNKQQNKDNENKVTSDKTNLNVSQLHDKSDLNNLKLNNSLDLNLPNQVVQSLSLNFDTQNDVSSIGSGTIVNRFQRRFNSLTTNKLNNVFNPLNNTFTNKNQTNPNNKFDSTLIQNGLKNGQVCFVIFAYLNKIK